ncbi:MAG: hypothetical protein CVU79_12225 [Elusimicrobia bacterium HGW-Elusimicrobia-3]|jgi:ABC-type amino acid transport substrate-binding protein|nr:MAG: hypothetical protein CVU79_12225 [Elusimicrobia bacterium HGW-Elusimicrobia-3]
MKKTLCRVLTLALLAALVPCAPCAAAETAAAGAQGNSPLLFVIERSKNANIVRYEANLKPDGSLDPKKPVVAYWLMLAKDGRRKKLNWIEKKKAYGIKAKPDALQSGYILTLAAARKIKLFVRNTGNTVRAEAVINGRPAILEKIFIKSHARLFGPKVDYMELYGKDPLTGESVSEKIVP